VVQRIKIPIFLLVSVVILFFFLDFLEWLPDQFIDSFFYATGLILINFLVFIVSIEYSFSKSNKTFLIFNLGGIAFRLILTLIGIFIAIKFLNIELYGFIFTLLIWYIMFIIYEIYIIRKKIEKPKSI